MSTATNTVRNAVGGAENVVENGARNVGNTINQSTRDIGNALSDGMNNIGTGITEAERIEYLNKEYQKDFFAEGQWFYFLKRHNLDTFYRCPVEEMRYYTFPTPDDEVEFGDVSN